MNSSLPRSAEKPVTERLTLAEAMPELRQKLRTRKPATERSQQERLQAEESLRQLFLNDLQMLYPDHPPMTEQFYYAKPRRFRADFAFVEQRLLVEIEGGVYTGEGHGGDYSGMVNDLRRSRHASAHGWRVFRISRPCLEKEPVQVFELLRESLGKPSPYSLT